jgi:hypothetical protein
MRGVFQCFEGIELLHVQTSATSLVMVLRLQPVPRLILHPYGVKNPLIEMYWAQGHHIEGIFPTDTHNDLVNDFVSVITSMAARVYGRRNSKRERKR